jgi:carboxymethylenebutenolidase
MMDGRHVSLPARGRGPGVLVLHEAWGLTADMAWAAERIAGMGYVAVAPDLKEAMRGSLGSVFQLIRGSGPLIEQATKEIDELLARPEVTGNRLGLVGFSMGAALALLLDRHPSVAVLGINYGMIPPRALKHRDLPVVASFGGSDRLLPRGKRVLASKLAGNAGRHDLEEYPSAGHSFMTPTERPESTLAARILNSGFQESAAEAAWQRLQRHFHHHLSPFLSADDQSLRATSTDQTD